MPVHLISEEKEKKIIMLSDVDVHFVSLVRHGANQQPFRVVKSEDKGGVLVSKDALVLQSLLVVKGMDVSKLAEKGGLAWLSAVDYSHLQEFDGYSKMVQVPEDKMDMDSMQMVKVHPDGAWVLVGKLAEGEKVDNVLMVSADVVDKALDIMIRPMDQAVASAPTVAISFGQLFDRELSAFLDVVYGTFNQSGSNVATRKKTIMSAIDALKMFLSVGIDSLGDGVVKLEKMSRLQPVTDSIDVETASTKDASHLAMHNDVLNKESASKNSKGGKSMFNFESEKDFTDAVALIVKDAVIAAKAEVDAAGADSAAKAQAEKEKTDAKAEMEGLKTTIATLETSVKELSGDPVTTAAAKEDLDGDGKKVKKEANLFKGAIFGR